MKEPTPSQELDKALTVLEDFNVWCMCGSRECQQSVNYEDAKQKLVELFKQHELSRKQEWVESLIKKLPLSNCVRHHSDDFSKDCTCDLINRDQITKTIKEQSKALRGVK